MGAIEFGDFQTPEPLAEQVARMLLARGLAPASVLEPTVGRGSLLAAALRAFPGCTRAAGFDIHPGHVREARARLRREAPSARIDLRVADVFGLDLAAEVRSLPAPVLLIGNPPWVTNAQLGSLRSANLPTKSNFQGRSGLDARTGKSNFDISEWIILRLLQGLEQHDGVLAMLCKTKVARRVLSLCAEQHLAIGKAAQYAVDARRHFGASVEACVLVCERARPAAALRCSWHLDLQARKPQHALLFTGAMAVSDARAFRRERELLGPGTLRWRSGIKHDCARVLELRRDGPNLLNADGARVSLEPDHVFPLMKGAELACGGSEAVRRFLLVPQRDTREDPAERLRDAPLAWRYLTARAEAFDKRASSVYARRPAFSIFGVGDYSFTPWKLAVPAMHKSLAVQLIGPRERRPVVFDDTCYLLPCRDELTARMLHGLLVHPRAQDFLRSMIFWSDKRPITRQLLETIDLAPLARLCGSTILQQLQARFPDRARLLAAWERLLQDLSAPGCRGTAKRPAMAQRGGQSGSRPL
jgi:methylase of polypeptide subunit release factors